MKKINITVCLLASGLVFSQVVVGGKTIVSNSSVALEFEDTEARGLILPWVSSASDVSGAVNGTLIFDASDKKVKAKLAAGWKDLSIDPNGSVDLSLQNSLPEQSSAKVSIGTTSSVPGILVLEDQNKAMILPKVAQPHLNIINPAPGMIVYDTDKKQLVVFNGQVWSFWGT